MHDTLSLGQVQQLVGNGHTCHEVQAASKSAVCRGELILALALPRSARSVAVIDFIPVESWLKSDNGWGAEGRSKTKGLRGLKSRIRDAVSVLRKCLNETRCRLTDLVVLVVR